MDHIAIDLGGKESQICVRSGDATITDERKWPTARLARYLKGRPKSRIVLEACSEAFAVAEAATELGHEVRVVPTTLVRALGVGARGVKTDRRDAQALSEASCRLNLPSIHVPSQVARDRKALCATREALISARTLMINAVRGWMRTHVISVRTGVTRTFPTRVREKLLSLPVGLPGYIDRLLVSIEALSEQIGASNTEVKELAEADPTCRRLRTVPGVGPVTSMTFTAALDQVERFAGAHAVELYLGLTPGENSSSLRHCRTGITKAGSPRVRRVMIQAAWIAIRTKPSDPMVIWAMQVAARRGRNIAAVALARKMVGVMYAVWRDGTVYNPTRMSEPRQTNAAAA